MLDPIGEYYSEPFHEFADSSEKPGGPHGSLETAEPRRGLQDGGTIRTPGTGILTGEHFDDQ